MRGDDWKVAQQYKPLETSKRLPPSPPPSHAPDPTTEEPEADPSSPPAATATASNPQACRADADLRRSKNKKPAGGIAVAAAAKNSPVKPHSTANLL